MKLCRAQKHFYKTHLGNSIIIYLFFRSSFKDSPITWLKNDSNINLSLLNTTNNMTARKYRETALGEMITDLSVDLTVLPLHEANKTQFGKLSFIY